MMKREIILSGFGGQGVMSIGKNLAEAGVEEGLEVSWVPSYGPEMRGGTASCSVILSDDAVGSPIVSTPDVLVAMNLPSLDKYESTVAPGGLILADSTLIERKVVRDDVKVVYIPATRMAGESGISSLANMIIVGKMLSELGDFEEAGIEAALAKVVSAKRADMLDANRKALKLGADYVGG